MTPDKYTTRAPIASVKTAIVLSLWKGQIPRRLTRREIAQDVAAKHRLRLDELMAKTPAYSVSRPRQEAMYVMLCEGHSQSSVARFFDLDRSCVIRASKVVPARLGRQAA